MIISNLLPETDDPYAAFYAVTHIPHWSLNDLVKEHPSSIFGDYFLEEVLNVRHLERRGVL